MRCCIDINGVEECAYRYKYIVARPVDCELWFWGAYNDFKSANSSAQDINGLVFINERVE